MAVELKSTEVMVREPQKVCEVLNAFAVEGVEIQLSESAVGWTLAMAFSERDPDMWEWPRALHRDLWPSEERYPDMEERDALKDGETEWDKVFEANGSEGFLALLRGLAPYLETPLLVLVAVWSLGEVPETQVWSIQPGTEEVETLEI